MVAVTSSGTAKVTLPTDEQILITREFDAPKHLVYRAWTTPELVKRWWSGQRGEMTIAEIDLRVGGKWRYVMVTRTRDSRSPSTASTARSSPTSGSSRPRSTRAARSAARGGSAAEHRHLHRGGRAHDPHAARADREQGGPRRDHRLRDGGRHAGGDGPPGAGRDLASLSARPHHGPPGPRSRWSALSPHTPPAAAPGTRARRRCRPAERRAVGGGGLVRRPSRRSRSAFAAGR